MMSLSRARRLVVIHGLALAGYVAVAILFTWPLVLHLPTALTGSPTGDTGNYVWNQWVFQHELLEHRSLPYFTSHLFGGHRPANLSLHNYTAFQNVIALPFVRIFGVVATFNAVYLLMTVLTAYCMFLLALDIGGSATVAWVGGLLFAWNPFMVTRGMGHFSLVAAAPLPLLLLTLRRAARHPRLRTAFAVGALVWWSASTDVYYAVYAVLIAVVFIAARSVSLHRRSRAVGPVVGWGLNVIAVSLAAIVAAILLSGGWEFRFLGRAARMRTLYTPVLALTTVLLIRGAWHVRASFATISRADAWRVCRLTVVSGVIAAVLLSPVLYAFGERIVAGDFNPPSIYWRSSPPGVDVLSLLVPNPNHVFTPQWVSQWLASGDYLENVASIPWVAMLLIAAALARGWRPAHGDVVLFATFVLLALGPFVYVGGINTHVPGPWALLRYVPVVGLARTPARFVAVVMLMIAVLFTSAVVWLAQGNAPRRRRLALIAGGLLLFELMPLPRTLYSATVPSIFRHVAAAPESTVILHLPFGVRDGTSSVGDFSAQTEFFQTAHGKTVMGGYLSRVSARRRREVQGDPVLYALAQLSERRQLPAAARQALIDGAPRLVRNSHVGFVVIDRSRASDDLRSVAIEAFRLEPIDRDGQFELYRPITATESGAGPSAARDLPPLERQVPPEAAPRQFGFVDGSGSQPSRDAGRDRRHE